MNFSVKDIKIYGAETAKLYASLPMVSDTDKWDVCKDTTLQKLSDAKSGSGHDCFLKGIVVTFTLTAPLYFWKQFQRYHFHDIISSQSTMHCIEKMSIQKQCNEHVDQYILTRISQLKTQWMVSRAKDDWYRLIASIPSGFMLTAGIVSNALQEKTIYQQRFNHKLDEWKEYCQIIKSAIDSEVYSEKARPE